MIQVISFVNFFWGDDGSQNMFVYQPTLDTLGLKKTRALIIWKSEGLFSSKLKALGTAFLHNIKLSGYKVIIKFDKDPLAVK